MRLKPKKDDNHVENIFWLTMTDLMTALVLVFMILFFYTYMTSFYEKIEGSAQQIKAFQALEENLNKQNLKTELIDKIPDNKTANIIKDNKKNTENIKNKAKDKKEKQINIKYYISKNIEDIKNKFHSKKKNNKEISQKEEKAKLIKNNKKEVAKTDKKPEQTKANVTINAAAGVVKISDLELFDVDSYELSENGKKYLAKFTPVYLDSIFSNEYLKNNIDKIIIQGHTDSQTYKGEYSADQQYMKNMELSLKRAYTVANFMTNTSYNKVNGDKLRKMIIVEGASYSNPVLVGGKEDFAKSRRVELKIVMKESNKYRDALKKLPVENQKNNK